MIRVVLDTNVLVSAVRADRGPLAVIREGWLTGRFQVYETLFCRAAWADHFLTLLKRTAVLQPIIEPVTGVANDPEDDWILATANSAQAQFVV